MADGIGNVSGYGYGIGGFMPRAKKDEVEKNEQQQAAVADNRPAETQVDPNKVMEFLANNNYFVAAPKANVVSGTNEVDAATQDRVAGYMEQFEMIYGIVQEEFGEELAPAVMDIVMDKLMGLTD